MSYKTIKASEFKPLGDKVFVTELESGVRKTAGGIIIPDDNMKDSGVRDRWGRVFAVGPKVDDLAVGEWVLIKHGRWTLGIDLELPEGTTRMWGIEYPEGILCVSETDPRTQKPTSL